MYFFQSQAVKAVEREPYVGEVVALANSGKRDLGAPDLDTPTRPCTRHGGLRDLQESSFSLSGKNKPIHLYMRAKSEFTFHNFDVMIPYDSSCVSGETKGCCITSLLFQPLKIL